MQNIIGSLDVTKLGTCSEYGNESDLIWLNRLHVHQVPVFDRSRSKNLLCAARHHNGIERLRVLNKAIKLQLIEHPDGLLRVLSLRAQSYHHTHHLLVDVLTNMLFLHALVIDFPAPTKFFFLSVAVDKSRVAHYIRHEAHIVSHITHQVFSLEEFACAAISQKH